MTNIFDEYTEEHHKENKILNYYYNKLFKKAFLSLKFNLFMEKSFYYFSPNTNPQSPNQTKYNQNIFSFFHNNLLNSQTNISDTFKQYTDMFNKENINIKPLRTNSSESEDHPSQITKECESVNQVNDLIGHLESRYRELAIQSKQMKQSLAPNENIAKHHKSNSVIVSSVSPNKKESHYTKAKQYSKKVINKNIKKAYKHNKSYQKQICVTCPYCVSKIYHDKCIGGNESLQQQFNPNILLGAPSFSKNTCNFIHKNLYY